MLVEAFANKGTHPDDIALARRLLSHDRREEIVAGLLRDHLGARPTAQDEASAARRASRPVAVRPPRRRERDDDRRAPPAAETPPRDRAAAPITQPTPELAPSAAVPVATPAAEGAHEPRRGRVERSPRREGRGAPRSPGGETRREARDGTPPVDRPRELERPRAAGARGVRHADLTNWQPPEEEGDDQPILRGPRERPQGETRAEAPSRESRRDRDRRTPPAVDDESGPPTPREPPPVPAPDDDFAEIWVSVGRRDGVRAGDLARALTEAEGAIARDDVRRIRVRDRHSFVAVRKADLERAVALLRAATIGGKNPTAEPARERPGNDEGGAERDT